MTDYVCRYIRAGLHIDVTTSERDMFVKFTDFIRSLDAPQADMRYTLKCTGVKVGCNKIQCIKAFRAETEWLLKSSKDWIEGVVDIELGEERAKRLQAALVVLGATVEMNPLRTLP